MWSSYSQRNYEETVTDHKVLEKKAKELAPYAGVELTDIFGHLKRYVAHYAGYDWDHCVTDVHDAGGLLLATYWDAIAEQELLMVAVGEWNGLEDEPIWRCYTAPLTEEGFEATYNAVMEKDSYRAVVELEALG